MLGVAVVAWFLLYSFFDNTEHPGLWATLVVFAPLGIWGFLFDASGGFDTSRKSREQQQREQQERERERDQRPKLETPDTIKRRDLQRRYDNAIRWENTQHRKTGERND